MIALPCYSSLGIESMPPHPQQRYPQQRTHIPAPSAGPSARHSHTRTHAHRRAACTHARVRAPASQALPPPRGHPQPIMCCSSPLALAPCFSSSGAHIPARLTHPQWPRAPASHGHRPRALAPSLLGPRRALPHGLLHGNELSGGAGHVVVAAGEVGDRARAAVAAGRRGARRASV